MHGGKLSHAFNITGPIIVRPYFLVHGPLAALAIPESKPVESIIFLREYSLPLSPTNLRGAGIFEDSVVVIRIIRWQYATGRFTDTQCPLLAAMTHEKQRVRGGWFRWVDGLCCCSSQFFA